MSLLQPSTSNASIHLFRRSIHYQNPNFPFQISYSRNPHSQPKPSLDSRRFSASAAPNAEQNPDAHKKPSPSPRKRGRPPKPKGSLETAADPGAVDDFPVTIPRKPRRGRRSEAVAVEDFVRERLEQVFASIRKQNAEVLEGKGEILKQTVPEVEKEVDGKDEEREDQEDKVHVVEEEAPDWPVDADVGWGVRASEYFEKHPIKNVVVDGVEIDWEGEMDEGWVQEINCLEWESFAFHPSPLIVLVFERYNRTADNWKLLKELEKAAKVYWSAKDRLPPRTIKIDMNIEKDLAYALKVKECPQLLFLKGNTILYREKEMRTADELVHMIAHFYYNAKRPSWVDPASVARF
ncbi:hypothetical protein AXF42_Ash008263 [Apostasia shenzhenica]|uniref:Thioredoxin-like fold domain-containing protein MRL7, chloroplastic n=1 Tax=Apostasia shenzhenica TaxID=1088818 RepID=A0A2I0AXE2_9ASPA|nr:hypothetical protein AXF42_Ash008263 [Apostasia shenzhenica]